jgi:hypothetical protein
MGLSQFRWIDPWSRREKLGKKDGARWGRDAISTNFDGFQRRERTVVRYRALVFYAPAPAVLASDTVRGASAACWKYNR